MRKILLTLFAAVLCAASMWADVAVDGKLPGAFTINSDGDQVWFSQGNLQATYNGSSWSWSFAEHQYDYIGNATANNAINGNGTVSTNGTVDLFGWSTEATTYGIHNSKDNSDYSGDFVDWGANAITNGGNEANAWRTLTKDEWIYLFDTRSTTSDIRYAKATVNNVAGLILLPDDWNTSYYALSNTNTTSAAFTSNEIISTDWTNSLEANGAVFLPAAGYRYGKSVSDVGSFGNYRSATPNVTTRAYFLGFGSTGINPKSYEARNHGYSVRLVSETAPAPREVNLTANGDPQNAGNYYSTFYDSSIKYELSAGAEAFVATISGDALVLTKIAGGGEVIPADNAVILKATGSAITLTPSDDEAVTFTATNNLLGANAATATPANCYVLSGGAEGVGFYRYTGDEVGAHKAYITYSGTGAPRRMRFVFDNEQTATGTDQMVNGTIENGKLLRDGQLIIIRDGVEYNAQGQIIK